MEKKNLDLGFLMKNCVNMGFANPHASIKLLPLDWKGPPFFFSLSPFSIPHITIRLWCLGVYTLRKIEK